MLLDILFEDVLTQYLFGRGILTIALLLFGVVLASLPLTAESMAILRTPTSTPGTPTPFIEPSGCETPPDDYTRVWINGSQLSVRTLAMLDHAQALYQPQGERIDLRLAITQGSYNAGTVAASFGTHDGGGAVDLSVRSRLDSSVLWDEIPLLIQALRAAGFAAWLRDTDDLYPGSPIHIHAIAIGDQELSESARAQIDGTFGYLRGFDGLPQIDGIPHPDPYGGPVICQWMVDLGFGDKRGWFNPIPTPGGTSQAVTDIP